MNELLYLGGFCLIQAMFFFVFPYKAQLNAAVSKGIPFADFPDVPRFRAYRLGLAGVSIAAFAALLFAARLPGVALIVGSLFTAAYVALDYRAIYREAPSGRP